MGLITVVFHCDGEGCKELVTVVTQLSTVVDESRREIDALGFDVPAREPVGVHDHLGAINALLGHQPKDVSQGEVWGRPRIAR